MGARGGAHVERVPRTGLAPVVLNRDLQSAKKLLVLGRPLDLGRGLNTRARSSFLRCAIFSDAVILFIFCSFVEADRGLEDKKDVVTCPFDFADGRGDAIRV